MEEGLEQQIHLGTCGWSVDDWRGTFYPRDLPHNQWLEFYARHLHAVEIDSTFTHIPDRKMVEHWIENVPHTFTFTCKLPGAITHEARLRDCRKTMEAFLDSIAPLRERLGCILVQLPPSFAPESDEGALRHFVMELPRRFRFAIEFRHPGWHVPRLTHFLGENGVAWAWTDTTPLDKQNRAPFEFLPQTADFLYVRLLGDLKTRHHRDGISRLRYGTLLWTRDPALEHWSLKVRKHLPECERAFVFANNHFEGFAPLTCQRLARRLGLEVHLPPPQREPTPDDSQLKLL